MKYYSDITKKFYESPSDCLAAEDRHQKMIEEAEEKKRKAAEAREAREKELEDARESYLTARKKYSELLNKFYADYGVFNYSSSSDGAATSLSDLFLKLLN